MTAGETARDEWACRAGECLFPARRVRFEAHDLSGRRDPDDRRQEHDALGRPLRARRSVVDEHSHPHEQMGMLLEGRLEFTVGGVTRLLGPGDIWCIPGGVVHSVRALDGPRSRSMSSTRSAKIIYDRSVVWPR